MGTSYFSSAKERREHETSLRQAADERVARIESARRKVAAQIVMAIVDKIVADIVRPGPVPEERECYEMAGEVRAIIPDLEDIASRIIANNGGVP